MADKPQHISDVDTWGNPDRNYLTFMIISVLFGFIGFDHFYLRSFATGTQKFIMNLFTFGLWYFWDLIQIFKDGDKVRKEGLNSPFDWIIGIGRGTFTQSGGGNSCNPPPEFAPKKSYLVYAILAICFGWLGADKFYLGEGWRGLAKLISCFNIFVFLFGWFWVIWDAFHAFFMTDDILKNGISVPLPYNFLFETPTPGSIFKVEPVDPKAPKPSWWESLFWLPLPSVPHIPVKEAYQEIVAPLMTVPVVRALESVDKLSSAIPQVPQIPAVQIPQIPTPQLPTMQLPQVQLPTAPKINIPHTPALKPMSGGGVSEKLSGPGPAIAGALTAIVLAGGLKGFYDFISKQYG